MTETLSVILRIVRSKTSSITKNQVSSNCDKTHSLDDSQCIASVTSYSQRYMTSTFNLNNEIGDQGEERLVRVLPKFPAFSHLYLGGNRIGSVGTLSSFHRLSSSGVRGCSISCAHSSLCEPEGLTHVEDIRNLNVLSEFLSHPLSKLCRT